MTAIAKEIEDAVRKAMPDVQVRTSKPVSHGGFFHVDLSHEGRMVAIQIEAPTRIGVTVLPSDYGVEADEYFTTPADAAQRVISALTNNNDR